MALHTVMVINAQNEPCDLGMLYDARKKTFNQARTLWDPATVLKRTRTHMISKTASDISVEDTVAERLSQLTVDGSKICVDDIKISHMQKNIILTYAANMYSQLMFSAGETIDTQQAEDVKSLATHVVTTIFYTVNASFEFASETADESRMQSMKITMKSFIERSLHDGKVDIKLSHEKKKTVTDNLTITKTCIPLKVTVTPLKALLRNPDVRRVTHRRDMMPYAFNLTLDPNTANVNLILSETNKMATYTVDVQTYPKQIERFDVVPQVLCTEKLDQQCYWEVEMKALVDGYVAAGVCYNKLQRNGDNCCLGYNYESWCIDYFWGYPDQENKEGDKKQKSNKTKKPEKTVFFTSKHNEVIEGRFNASSTFPKLGVFLNWPGTLSFYEVLGDILRHLHTFENQFSEPLYPAFKVCKNSSVCLTNLIP